MGRARNLQEVSFLAFRFCYPPRIVSSCKSLHVFAATSERRALVHAGGFSVLLDWPEVEVALK